MKKLYLLLAIAVVMLTACAPAQNQSTQSEDLGCEELTTFENLTAYEQFISAKRLPENFVHWNSIAEWGKTLCFVPTKDFPNRYIYIINDTQTLSESTDSLTLEINHSQENSNGSTSTEYKSLSITKDMTDMRQSFCTEEALIVRRGVEYYYNKFGGLHVIKWHNDGLQFKITGQMKGFSSPLYDRMVSISETEAAEAFAEIKQSLDAS